MSTEFYLQTRGKTIDYRFLYESPRSEWWCDYAEYTLFEDRTIILEQLNDENGRLYLSGIPSDERRDRVNTVIRYTLVAEFNKSEGSEILPLLDQFFRDCSEDSKVLGRLLDHLFLEQNIEDVLRFIERNDEKRHEEISAKIENLVRTLKILPVDKHNIKGIYSGGLGSKLSRLKWLSLAEQILDDGKPGIAALLNATLEKSLPSLKVELLRKIENAFILLTDGYAEPKQVEDLKKNNVGRTQDIRKRLPEASAPEKKI